MLVSVVALASKPFEIVRLLHELLARAADNGSMDSQKHAVCYLKNKLSRFANIE
jgi:hypothetical protein